MNTPHTHPRATEILYAVNGTLTSGTIGENGSRFVFNTVHTGQATVFPVGSVHYQSNEGCEPMTFVCKYQLRFVRVWIVSYVFFFAAAFSYEDPGTLSIAQRCTYTSLRPTSQHCLTCSPSLRPRLAS